MQPIKKTAKFKESFSFSPSYNIELTKIKSHFQCTFFALTSGEFAPSEPHSAVFF